MAGQAGAGEHLPGFRPWTRQAHDRRVHLSVALQAGRFRIDRLAQREAVIALRRTRRRGALRLVARIGALVAGGAREIHQLPRQRRDQMAPMEGVLFAAVGGELLVPGLAGARLDACRRGIAHLVIENFAMAGKALPVARRLDRRPKVDGVVGGTQDVLAGHGRRRGGEGRRHHPLAHLPAGNAADENGCRDEGEDDEAGSRSVHAQSLPAASP